MYTRPPRVDRRIKYVVDVAVLLSLCSTGKIKGGRKSRGNNSPPRGGGEKNSAPKLSFDLRSDTAARSDASLFNPDTVDAYLGIVSINF